MQNKCSQLEVMLNDLESLIFCMSEHWLNNASIEALNIKNYSLISYFCRNNKKHGGTAILVHENISHRCKNLNYIVKNSIEMEFECSAISLDKKVFIACLYRPPSADAKTFFSKFDEILNLIIGKFEYVVIVGDLNIDKFSFSANLTSLNDLLNSYQLTSVINEPTRIAYRINIKVSSCIDHCITNNSNNLISTVIDNGISDHTAQSIELDIKIEQCKRHTIMTRKFDEKSFEHFYQSFEVNKFKINTCTNDTNIMFDSFLSVIDDSFDEAFPPVFKDVTNKIRK